MTEPIELLPGYPPVLLRWALQYATGGIPIFPCCPADGAFLNYKGEPIKAKAPLVFHGFKDATTDLDQIARWWGRDYRFAMIGRMVPVDQVCVDIDPWKGGSVTALEQLIGPLPATQTTYSGRGDGGTHLFFRWPLGALVSTKLPKGIDLRIGGNHYTIIAPSIHPDSGKPYRWGPEPNPVDCPEDLAHLLAKPEASPQERFWKTGEAAGYLDNFGGPMTRGQISGILRKVGTAPNGDRNNILFWGACRFFEHKLAHAAVTDLANAGRDSQLDDKEIERTIDSASLRYLGVKHGYPF